MKVGERTYVAIDYKLTLDSGEVADQSEAGSPLGFVYGSGQIISGLEKALEGMQEGETASVSVEPDDAYGQVRPELYRDIPRENFPQDLEIKPGMAFEARGPHGPVTFQVKEVSDENVVADFNHPLAGQSLHFDVKVAEVREPNAEELATLMNQEGCSPSACAGCSSDCG